MTNRHLGNTRQIAIPGSGKCVRGLAALLLIALLCVGCGAPAGGDGSRTDAASTVGGTDASSPTGNTGAASTDALPEGMRVVRVAQADGTVSCYKGNVGEGIKAVPGMNLGGGDGIGTGPASGALMEIDGDKTVEAGESIRMTIASLLGDALKNNTVMTLESGSAFFRLHRKLGEGETFEVETPTCILGVRGTQFYVTVTPEATLVGVFEGRVRVELRAAPTTTGAATTLTTGAIVLTGNDWLTVPNGPLPAEGLVVKPITLERMPPFVQKAIKEQPEGIPEKWGDTSGPLPEPDWALFDQLNPGMTMLDAQTVLAMDGEPSEGLPGMRTFWLNGATLNVVADPAGKVTSVQANGFPMPLTETTLTKEQWHDAKLLDKTLADAEAILGTNHRLAGKSVDVKTGVSITRIEWKISDTVRVNVSIKNGIIDTYGSVGAW